MKTSRFSLLALPLILLVPLPALASEPVAAKEPVAACDGERTFDLGFPGGSFQELVQQIAGHTGRTPNVIIGDEARALILPAFELFSVSVDDVFTAIATLLRAGPSHRLWLEKLPSGIWTVGLQQGRTSPAHPAALTRVFQVREILDDLQLEDLTTAIETAWEMAEAGENGRLRFHQETRLLFVRGNEEHIHLVEQVLHGVLQKSRIQPPPSPPPAAPNR
jgi:hypothetical protein